MEVSTKRDIVRAAFNMEDISKYLDFVTLISWKLSPNEDDATEFGNPLYGSLVSLSLTFYFATDALDK
jgi:hypothetical protein